MAEYIDKEKLLQKLSRMIEYCKNDNEVNGLTALFQVGDAIMDCPTADVQEVRHGHWITKGLDNFRKIECKCSECGYIGISNYDSYDDPYDFNYCPNCGAKMDEEI